jgi:anthranilate phosphoribosyltransferase
MDGMDEVTLTAPTRVADICNGTYRLMTVEPEDFGLIRCRPEDLVGGDAQCNARLVRAVLSGEKGPKRDVVLLNSAFSLMAVDEADGIPAGLEMAAKAIDDGRALAKLNALIRMTEQ